VSVVNVLIGLVQNSAEMFFRRPPFDCSSRESRSSNALLWRTCEKHDIEGQSLAMWPLVMSWTYIGHLRVLVHGGGKCCERPTQIEYWVCIKWM
jgi:hypothetical protein